MRRIDPEENQASWLRADRAAAPGVDVLFADPDADHTDAERAARVLAYAEGEVDLPETDDDRRRSALESIHAAQRTDAASAFDSYDAPPDVAFPTDGLSPGRRVTYLGADRRVHEGEVVAVEDDGVTITAGEKRETVAPADVLAAE